MTSRHCHVRVVDFGPERTRSRRVASTRAERVGSRRVRARVRHRRRPRTAARAAAVCAATRNRLERRHVSRRTRAATMWLRLDRHDRQRSTSGATHVRRAVSMRGRDRRISGLVAAQHVEVATTSGAENARDVLGTVDDRRSAQLQRLVGAVLVSRRRLHHLGVDTGRHRSSPATTALTSSSHTTEM